MTSVPSPESSQTTKVLDDPCTWLANAFSFSHLASDGCLQANPSILCAAVRRSGLRKPKISALPRGALRQHSHRGLSHWLVEHPIERGELILAELKNTAVSQDFVRLFAKRLQHELRSIHAESIRGLVDQCLLCFRRTNVDVRRRRLTLTNDSIHIDSPCIVL